ncbi:glutathione S-transferase N-terminal domain-containing protein [Mesorhizobium sp. YC-39]|uniref:glutathione S-transferase family protein n=1 Tax=unclassified Mesorhizobium TaxID=325217 RepID=UPI0021E91730|nr:MULTISPECIES: glutathione S-transferase N-terminal domain-containing protein [unclassified Mesorhizobium]MCV3205627.1 glutathione S-transferase N-terminal domain-containing protein [Mesorhizobium sp. YC-2]MCV3227974.1 glutathione S-transferase N-terminal domain-containing protein [Mesorhizobium sp. YC-39]
MKLFWSTRSPFVRKVMIVAHELGIAGRIERVRMVVHPAKPNAEVMRFHPLSKIPALILDDGQVIYDSRVICEYLDAEFGEGALVPASGATRWQVLTRHSMIDALIETCVMWNTERGKADGRRDEEVIQASALRATSGLDALERNTGLHEGALTLSHVAAASALAYLDFRFGTLGWREGRPRLAVWFEEFSKRPSFIETAFADIY